jgi:hypothetical protein
MKKMGVSKMAVVSVEYGTLAAIKAGLVFIFFNSDFLDFSFYLCYSNRLHQDAGIEVHRTQDCYDFGIDSQTL